MSELTVDDPVLTLPNNDRGRDIFVGDIHGHFKKFNEGLEQLNFDPTVDRIISVGDLVDRGEASLECLRLLNQPWFYSVAGNHERMLHDMLTSEERFEINGNGWMFTLSDKEKAECLALTRKMHWAITISDADGDIGVVHADVPEGLSWGKFTSKLENTLLNTIEYATDSRKRVELSNAPIEGVTWVFIGHHCIEKPTQFDNVVCIDTGVFVPLKYGPTFGLTFATLENNHPTFLTIESNKWE